VGNVTAGQGAFAATAAGKGANDFYVQQWVRLGIGYDLSPDVNFYMEIIDSANWGSNGNPNNAGNGGDPLNHNCGAAAGPPVGGGGNCRLGVRAAYVLVRNMFDVQGLSMKAGRQYVIFGNHSVFGHFDWANTGYSHDGIMFNYSTKNVDSYLGWFRNSETDLNQAAPVGSLGANVAGCNATGGAAPAAGGLCTPASRAGTPDGSGDADMIIFYNQIKNVPGFLIEPYYILYSNSLASDAGFGGLGNAKHANQIRHNYGVRVEMRKGNWDFITEDMWQTGRMGAGLCRGGVAAGCAGGALPMQSRDTTINAWGSRNWLGYTWYQNMWKPRLAFGFDYASGDGNANCSLGTGAATAGQAQAGQCRTANTFENFFPTNHIHMGYMDIMAWKNMWSPQINLQMRPSERDHFEFWWANFNLASARDNWYRAAQGPYVWSKNTNTKTHVGDEVDFTWTRMFADGKVAFQATYGHLFSGDYIKSNLGTNSDQSWGFVQLWMNF
jgi:hypothetical protein